MKIVAACVVLLGASVAVYAVDAQAPEIDGSTAVSTIALVAGGLLVLRGRRKR